MRTKVTVKITMDDLSEECRQQIERLKQQGYVVDIEWPNGIKTTTTYPTYPTYPWHFDDGFICNDCSNRDNTTKTTSALLKDCCDNLSKICNDIHASFSL